MRGSSGLRTMAQSFRRGSARVSSQQSGRLALQETTSLLSICDELWFRQQPGFPPSLIGEAEGTAGAALPHQHDTLPSTAFSETPPSQNELVCAAQLAFQKGWKAFLPPVCNAWMLTFAGLFKHATT